jgi:hypothetical protein
LNIGRNDNATPLGDGGGINASFLEVNGVEDALPGSPASSEVDYEVDDDYYFAGAYTSVIPGNGTYTPVGLVYANEEGTGKGLTADNNQLRFHFNLPANLKPEDVLSFTFEALALDDTAGNPRYGVEVYFNNVLIQTQIVINPALVGQTITTPRFTAGSVNALVGLGFDNIITIKGTDFIDSDGGYFINFDYFQLNPHPNSPFPWTVGLDDNGWPCNAQAPCSGGEANANFVQENGAISPLPGRADSPVADQQSDNDYYFAGDYSTVIDSVAGMYGGYVPIGPVLANEQSAERAFAAADNDLRYHFNLPATLKPEDTLSVTFDAFNLHTDGQADPRYGVEVYFNGILVQTQIVIRPAQLNVDYTTPEFTLASVNAQVGPGYDNIVSLKGINYNNEGGGNWMGIDYVQLNGPKPLAFLPTVITNGQVVLNWTSTGNLEWAPTVLGPWTPILPPPTPPYAEAIVSNTNRFFRLSKP